MQHLGFTRLGNPNARPLVIIHGWGCDSSFLLPLANMFLDRDVYLIDLPGYGKSSLLAPIANDFSATIMLLINTIPDNADVISWSFGTIFALRCISVLNSDCLNLKAQLSTTMVNPTIEEINNNYLKSDSHPINKRPLNSLDLEKGHHANVFAQDSIHLSIGRNSLLETAVRENRLPHVRSLVTICGSPRFPSDPNWPGISPIRILKCNTELTPRRLQMVLGMFYHMQITDRNEDNPETRYLKALIAKKPQVSSEVLLSGIRLVTYIDERPAIDHLRIPSLHLLGAHDRLVPYQLASYFSRGPLHLAHVFPYSAHNPYLSEPEAFQKVVKGFYERLDHIDHNNAKVNHHVIL